MTTTSADVIRPHYTEAQLTHTTLGLRAGQWGHATNTNRTVKRDMTSAFHYNSDDDADVIYTGTKTFSGNMRLDTGASFILHSSNTTPSIYNDGDSITLECVDYISLIAKNSVTFAMSGTPAPQIVVVNEDDTNGSTSNNLSMIYQLTPDASASLSPEDAFKISVQKLSAWDGSTSENEVVFAMNDGQGSNTLTSAVVITNGSSTLINTEDGVRIKLYDDYCGDPQLYGGQFQIYDVGSDELTFWVSPAGVVSGSAFYANDMEGKRVNSERFRVYTTPLDNTIAGADGVIQYDNTVFRGTQYRSGYTNVGAFSLMHYRTLSADTSYENQTSASQKWFPTSGTMYLPGDMSYKFEGLLALDNGAGPTVALNFAGGATITNIMYEADSCSEAVNVISTTPSRIRVNTTASTIVANTSLSSGTTIKINGIVRISGNGTFIPQFKYGTTLPGTGNIARNSYFILTPIGANNALNMGWQP